MRNFFFTLLFALPQLLQAGIENYVKIPLGNGMTAYPSVKVKLTYDDNIFFASNNKEALEKLENIKQVKSSWVTEINPRLQIETKRAFIGYEGRYGIFHSSQNDNYNEHYLRSGYRFVFNKRNQSSLNFDLIAARERRGTGISDDDILSNDEPDQYRDIIAQAEHRYGARGAKGKLVFTGRIFDRNYTNNDSFKVQRHNRTEAGIKGTFYYRLSPRTALVFLGQFRNIRYEHDNYDLLGTLDSTEQRYEAGIKFDISAKTSGTATLGQTLKNFRSSRRQDSSLPSWEISTRWSPKTYSHFTLLFKSAPSESNGTGNFRQKDYYYIDWKHEWSHRINTVARLSYKDIQYDGTGRADQTTYFSLGVNYKPVRRVSFGLSYISEDRDSSLSTEEYSNHQLMLHSRVGW